MQERYRFVGALFLVMTALCACAGEQYANEAVRPGSDKHIWSVELLISGGFAGIEQQIIVDSTGKLHLRKNASAERLSSRADSKLMTYLDGFLKAGDAEKTRQAMRGPAFGCADCLNYDITILTNGNRVYVRLNTISLKTSPYGVLVAKLTAAAQALILDETARKNK